jgi:hypothetical protein
MNTYKQAKIFNTKPKYVIIIGYKQAEERPRKQAGVTEDTA